MGLLDRHPVLRRAVANQYQAILAAGAVGFSVLFANPLPLLLSGGLPLSLVDPRGVLRGIPLVAHLDVACGYVGGLLIGHLGLPLSPDHV